MIFTLFAFVAASQLGTADQPDFVKNALAAIDSEQAETIRTNFREIVEVGDEGSSAIPAAQALTLLSGCRRSNVRLLHGDTYTVDYECKAKRALAKGCDSGDLFLILDEGRRSLAVAHRRKLTLDCPPPAPPAPPLAAVVKLQGQITSQLLKAGLSGDERVFSQKVRPGAEIFFGEGPVQRKRLSVGLLKKLIENCHYDGKMEGDGESVTIPMICSGTEKRTLTFFFLRYAVTSVASSNAIIPKEFGGPNG